MGVGLTSLGHPWTGRRRPHNHYVIGDPADTTPTAHSVGTAGRRSPSTEDCWPPGGATEELLSTTLLGSLARGHKADYSGAARVQRFPAQPAADPTGNAGHRAEPRRSCSATTPSRRVGRRPRWGNCGPQCVLRRSCLVLRDSATPTADLSGTRALVEPRELRAGASTSRRYGPRTRMEPRAIRAGGAA